MLQSVEKLDTIERSYKVLALLDVCAQSASPLLIPSK